MCAILQKEALEKPENFEPYLGWLTVPEGNIVLVLRGRNPEHPLMLTREQVDEMTLHQHIHMWKDFVEQMAMALLDAQGDLNSAAGKHLQVSALQGVDMHPKRSSYGNGRESGGVIEDGQGSLLFMTLRVTALAGRGATAWCVTLSTQSLLSWRSLLSLIPTIV